MESLSPEDIQAIDGVQLERMTVTLAELSEFAREVGYPYYYYRDSRPSYLLWHYVGLRLSEPSAGETLVDIGAQAGVWSRLVRKRVGARCYDLDLEFRPGLHGTRIGAGADAIPLPDESVTTFASFCAFNCFEGPSDIGFMAEAVRCLRPGGRIVIVPVCLGTAHVNVYDPAICDREESFDPGARREAWHGWGNNFGRWYDPAAFRERLLDNLPGFSCTIWLIDHQVPGIPWPGNMYAAVLQKPAQAPSREADPSIP